MATEDSVMEDESEEWNPEVRRQKRRDIRRIINEVQERREEITQPEDLVPHVKDMNEVFVGVVSTREAAIDAEGFKLLSAIGKEQAETCAGELIFDPIIFTEKLVTFMGGRRGDGSRLDWAKLGEQASSCFLAPPPLSFLYGALDPERIIRRQRQNARKKDSAEAKVSKPKELTEFEDEEESTTKDVAHIFRHLRIACDEGNGRVHYFSFLVDPDSFARTVENIFHFSFLVKDGRAGIHIDENEKQPYIHLPEGGKSDKTERHQGIVSMNMANWERAVEKFNLVSARIPPRES